MVMAIDHILTNMVESNVTQCHLEKSN